MNNLEAKALRLKRLKWWASLLLLAMVFLFIVSKFLSYYYSHVWKIVAAFAEAAMIGALADWYAVTALFRHPLGLKIPHTNLLVKNKDKFAVKMADFVQEHFLKPEILAQKIEKIPISQEIGKWLNVETNREKLVLKIAQVLPKMVEQIDEKELNDNIQQKITTWVYGENPQQYAFELAEYLLKAQYHQKVLDTALAVMIEQVNDVENRQKIQAKVKEESPKLLPSFIGKAYTHSFLEAIENFATEIKDNPEHKIRIRFEESIRSWIERFKGKEYEEKIAGFKTEMVESTMFQEQTNQLWTKLKTMLLTELTKDSWQKFLHQELADFAQTLTQPEGLSQEINTWVKQTIVNLVEEYQTVFKEHIIQTVKSWDSQLSDRMELEVGKDLQFIRINGTLVGGLVGLILYLASETIPQWLQQ